MAEDEVSPEPGPSKDDLLARVEEVRAKSRARREKRSGVYRFPDEIPTPPEPRELDIEEDRRWWDR